MSMIRNLLSPALVMIAASPLAAQCTGTVFEYEQPPAVTAMATTDPGFSVRYWAWDDANRRRGGVSRPVLEDSGNGIVVRSLDWDQAEVCLDAGPVERTTVLLESLGPDGFGRWALVNLGAARGGDTNVDVVQNATGSISSRAVALPSPSITAVRVDSDRVEVDLEWNLDLGGEALADLTDSDGLPLPSVRGASVFVVNGPTPTARPWDWSWAADLGADAVNGFSTDTTATISLDRSSWLNQTVAFALALTYDGDGDASGEGPSSRSVHGSYLGRPTAWMALPPTGIDLPVALVGVAAGYLDQSTVWLTFTGQAEPVASSYRVWAQFPGRRWRLLAKVDGGLGAYGLEIDLASRRWPPQWVLGVEMLDHLGRVVADASVPMGIGL